MTQKKTQPPEQAEGGVNLEFHLEPDDWLPGWELRKKFHPMNSQVRSERDLESIMRSIEEIGFTGEMIEVNSWNDKIVSGHGRVMACITMGYDGALPVKYRNYPSEALHRARMMARNKARGDQDPDREKVELLYLMDHLDEIGYDQEGLEGVMALPEGGLDDFAAELDELVDMPDDAPSDKRIPADVHKAKVALLVPDVLVFERALASTGIKNRADALMTICRAYLGEEGLDIEEGQFVVFGEGASAPEVSGADE